MEYAHTAEYVRSVQSLYQRGGKFQKAANIAHTIWGRVGTGVDPFDGIAVTKHGETRIKHCIKYDLTGFVRLITVQHKGVVFLLFCGDHDDSDKWLNQKKGLTPTLESKGTVCITFVSSDKKAEGRLSGMSGHASGLLYEQLPDEVFERLTEGLPRKIIRRLESLDGAVLVPELWEVVASIADAQARAIYDTFALLRQGYSREALERARLYFGETTALEEVPLESLPAIVDNEIIRRIPPTSPQYQEAVKRFTASSRYRDWMLFMHPDQEAIVAEDFSGPAKLVGVSGSGKTCVVVQRAVRLAAKYPQGRILVLTLNRALAGLINQLVDTCAGPGERSRIDVMPFFALCRQVVLRFEPGAEKSYGEITWKMNEHVDEIWKEYYRCETNNYDASVMYPVHDHLLARGWDPEPYLKEELDWLRSALNRRQRRQYIELERRGRAVPLSEHFRDCVLKGAKGWEDKMEAVGVIDGLGIAQALARHREKLTPQYRCVLVDEAQDFGNIELDLVRRLVAPNDNDLFLCGDAAQAVTTKYQSLRAAGIDVPGARSRKLALNYRNSKDVLLAAHQVLYRNVTEEMLDREDFDILAPELSTMSGATPLLLQAGSLEEEISHAIPFVQEVISGKPAGKGCIAVCGFSLLELEKYSRVARVALLNGERDIDTGAIFLSDLEQTKGFEFDVMCIVNCSAGILPNVTAPESERFRDLARLYVAMTRAKTDLVLSWSGARSPFLDEMGTLFLEADWSQYAGDSPLVPQGRPKHLDELERTKRQARKWEEMSGAEFLHTPAALGLSIGTTSKIRQLVDGKGLKRGRIALRWRTLGSAASDATTSSTAAKQWGPTALTEFLALSARLAQE